MSDEYKGTTVQTPTRFRKKPTVIEAIQWRGTNLKEVIDFTGLHRSVHNWTWEEYKDTVARGGLKVFTLNGPVAVEVGEWIIKGIKGEFYPCKQDIFEATYEREPLYTQPPANNAAVQEPKGSVGALARKEENRPHPAQSAPISPRAAVLEAARLCAEYAEKYFLYDYSKYKYPKEARSIHIHTWCAGKMCEELIRALADTMPDESENDRRGQPDKGPP